MCGPKTRSTGPLQRDAERSWFSDQPVRSLPQRAITHAGDRNGLQETVRGAGVVRRSVRRRSITMTAYDVGYNSPSAFTAAFHRTFGLSPSQYRTQ